MLESERQRELESRTRNYSLIGFRRSRDEKGEHGEKAEDGDGSLLGTGVTDGGDMIRPGAGAQYILMFKTAGPNCSSQGPSGLRLPTGGAVFGPLTWAPLNSTASSYDRTYAVFTDSFNFAPGASCYYPFWFSGPQGFMTASLNGGSYGGLNQYTGTTGGFGWGTSISDVYTPGNYTLHFVNNGTGNVTARVANGAKPGNFLTQSALLVRGCSHGGSCDRIRRHGGTGF